MDGLGPRRADGLDDAVHVEVALERRAPARCRRPRRPAGRGGRPVGFGIDGDRGDAHLAAGPDDPDGDLAAVGDQDLLEHPVSLRPLRLSLLEERGHALLAFGADPQPGDHRAPCSALASSKLMPGTRLEELFAAGQRLRPGREEQADDLVDFRRRAPPAGRRSLTRPISSARRGVDPLARQEIPPGLAFADAAHDVRRDAAGTSPILTSLRPNLAPADGDDDVAGGEKARPAADGRAVHPGDRRLGQGIELYSAARRSRAIPRGSARTNSG